MPGDDSNHFSGDPLAGSSTRARFYAQITGPRVTAGLGDAVQVARPDGTYAGIIIALWQEGSKKKPKDFVEVLWFDTLKDQEKRPQELLITPESSVEDIDQIQALVSVKSLSEWEEEERHSLQQSKKAKASRYFCQYGFLERTQTKTAPLNWSEFYMDSDRADLDAFQEKVETTIMAAAKSKLSSRLSNKIQAKPRQTKYVVRESPESDAASVVASESYASSEEDQELNGWANASRPRGTMRTRSTRTQEDARNTESETESILDGTSRQRARQEYDSDMGTPRTPRKRRTFTTPKSPRTPRPVRTPKSVKVTTPGSKSYRIQAPLEVTPLPSRIKDLAAELNLSPHQLARQRLHVAEVPTSLPCRETEFAAIFEQVESAILENESALIYVSGTPGTGKTATVREVIAALQQRVAEEELFPFKFVEINGMKIPDPTQAYSRLWETLTGQRVTANHALSLLQSQFATSNAARMPCVVLMDELDQLTTTKQEVMYNFFQWPNMPNTKLIVVAVANTMDLPERTLAHKVSSRLGLTRIAFTAYTRPQLKEIIKSRLSTVESLDVEDAAIDYACLRVSRVSGDARRALDICRRAFELAEPGFNTASIANLPGQEGTLRSGTGQITIGIMKKAFEEMTSSPLQVYLKSLPFASKIFLKALMTCIRRSGLMDTSLGEITEDATRICKTNTGTDLTLLLGLLQPYGIARTAHDLAEGGIVYMEQGKGERTARIRLRVPESDLLSSWSEDLGLARIT